MDFKKLEKIKYFETEKISNFSFKFMTLILKAVNFFMPAESRAKKIGIKKGMTVIDIGCGPGLFIKPVADLIGPQGHLYALDVQELAIESVEKIARKYGFNNVEGELVVDYSCRLPDAVADLIYCLDVIHMVPQPDRFFKEMRRLVKSDGVLVIDKGHLKLEDAKSRILHSGFWKLETDDGHLIKCNPA